MRDITSPQWTNAQVFLGSEFPWSVTMAWMSSYLTLFLVDEHLAPHQIGLAMGMGAFLQVIGLGFSGSLSRKIGRKGSILSGDFAGWVLVLGVWALSRNPLWLGVGVVVNQAMGFVGPAWNSLFSEGEDSARLPRYFFILQLLTVAGGLVLPIMEPWISHQGVVHTGHRLLLVLWPLVALAWTSRLLWLRESETGRHQMGSRESFSTMMHNLRRGLRGTGSVLAGLRVMVQVPLVLFANLAPLALVASRGSDLAPSRLAWLPVAATAAALGLAGLQSRMDSRHNRVMVGVRILLLFLGFGLLAMTGPGHFWRIMVAWALVTGGQTQFWTSHTSYWMTWLPDAVRVDVQGWIGVVTAGLVAVLSPLVAPVFAHAPHPLFWGIEALFGAAMLFWNFLPHPHVAEDAL